MGEPLTLDEVGVTEEDAAQVIYDLRRSVKVLEDRLLHATAIAEAGLSILRRITDSGDISFTGRAAQDFQRIKGHLEFWNKDDRADS